MPRLGQTPRRDTAAGSDHAFDGRTPIREALATLRLRLLDLTARNRLLNFKHSPGKSLQLADASYQNVVKRLLASSASQVAINPVPEPKREEWIREATRLVRPDVREYAKRCGVDISYELESKHSVPGSESWALHYPEELARHCRKLAREAKSAIE